MTGNNKVGLTGDCAGVAPKASRVLQNLFVTKFVMSTKWKGKVLRISGRIENGLAIHKSAEELWRFYQPKDFWQTEDEAFADAERRRQKNIAILQRKVDRWVLAGANSVTQKKIDNLKSIRFEIEATSNPPF